MNQVIEKTTFPLEIIESDANIDEDISFVVNSLDRTIKYCRRLLLLLY